MIYKNASYASCHKPLDGGGSTDKGKRLLYEVSSYEQQALDILRQM